MNRPPVEKTCCQHECANGKVIIKNPPKGGYGDYHPCHCKYQPFQCMRYDIVQGQFKQARAVKYNRGLRNKQRMTITVDTTPVTALSVVIRY